MHTYWYVSTDKLEALGASHAGMLGRLRTTLKLGVGGTGVEVGLDGTPTRSLDRAVDRAEKRLRRRGDIGDIADFADVPPPAVYFASHGPASRAVIEGMFGPPPLTTTWRSCLSEAALMQFRRDAIRSPPDRPEIQSAQFGASCNARPSSVTLEATPYSKRHG